MYVPIIISINKFDKLDKQFSLKDLKSTLNKISFRENIYICSQISVKDKDNYSTNLLFDNLIEIILPGSNNENDTFINYNNDQNNSKSDIIKCSFSNTNEEEIKLRASNFTNNSNNLNNFNETNINTYSTMNEFTKDCLTNRFTFDSKGDTNIINYSDKNSNSDYNKNFKKIEKKSKGQKNSKNENNKDKEFKAKFEKFFREKINPKEPLERKKHYSSFSISDNSIQHEKYRESIKNSKCCK